jgi:hypothetical protein
MRYPVVPVTLRIAFGAGALLCVQPGYAKHGDADLSKTFSSTVQPFVHQYCAGCHSGKAPAGGLDLKAYTSIQTVIADSGRWTTVADKLAAKQMPPAKMPQPPDAARQQVISWVKTLRTTEARKNAGDPGPVLARRLSNAEYNYTIRDLTGVDMKPTREFPIDPANPAGFDNSGESLTMSPALLGKYLQAAREVSDHMVLTPDGFTFAPASMLAETDRDQFAVKRIVDFYESQPTDYADYFEAAWRYKHRAALGHRAATLTSTATAEKVSPKYLPLIWGILGEDSTPGRRGKVEVGPIARLQAMWKSLPAPIAGKVDEAALRAKCVEMRDFVVKIRKDTAMQFTAPIVKGPPQAAGPGDPPAPVADAVQANGAPAARAGGRGRGGFRPPRGLPAASQPLLTWKYTQFNTHRRDFDSGALRLDTDPPQTPPAIPKFAGLHQEAAVRWAAVMKTAQLADPDLVIPAGKRAEYEESFARFANVFPDAFYIKERGKFFPDDSSDSGRLLSAGYHSVMGFWRDDLPLQQLILDDKGKKELDRLWTEFDFFADYTARTFAQFYFNQSGEVLGHGAESGHPRPVGKAVTDASVIAAIRDEYTAYAKASGNEVAAAWMPIHFDNISNTLRSLEKMRVAAEPAQLDALLKFATRAYRRPLTKAEQDDVLAYYHQLRTKGELSHQEAIRDSIVSILMAPDFLYRLDLTDTSETGSAKILKASAKVKGAEPLSGYALANRLSYFLWSSMPDDELMQKAASGELQKKDVLMAEVRRMLQDQRMSGMATEFAGNLLEFRQFETYNSVDRMRFPEFTNGLRQAMFEEPVRFVQDAIQNDRSVLDMLYGKYTFVNPELAKFYGMPEVKGGVDTWVRVDDANKYGRGGLLPMGVFLTENSPGLRTSPVKRGHWLVKDVLGEIVPPPPPVVPELPSDEAKTDLPIRDLLVQHRQNPMCAACHARFDPLGLAFEGYGPVGRVRAKDLGGRPIDASAEFPGGVNGTGLQGVLDYIRDHREKDFVDNLSRKLLAYSLDRSLMLSDEPLVEKMEKNLVARKYQFDSLIETIVTSPQFLDRRGPQQPQEPDNRRKIALKTKKTLDNKGA